MNDELNRFREAGKNGLNWQAALDLVDPSIGDDLDPETFDAASAAYDAGQRERARSAVEAAIVGLEAGCDPFIPWRKSDTIEANWLRPGRSVEVGDVELTAADAELLIEAAAQAAAIEPEEILSIVREYCPLPSNAVRLAEMAVGDFQAIPKARPERPTAPAELRDVPEARVTARREALGFPPAPSPTLRWVDYAAGGTYTPPTWLVKNFMPSRGLGMLYGESSAGKTFLAIHAALCVAWGMPFFGRRAKPGGVLYIAAEGGSGVLPRFDAAEKALGIGAANLTGQREASAGRAPIRIVTEAPNLSRDGDRAPLERTIRETAADFERQGSRLALVVVDTWHATLGGADENSAADAGHALKPLKDAVEELGVYMLILHHPGKDAERGARGSGALLAAVDTSIELRVIGAAGQGPKPSDMLRVATINKQRDGAVGEGLHYRLPVTRIGTDEDGEPWTTCTVVPCDPPALDSDGLSKGDRQFTEAVRASLVEAGGPTVKLEIARLRFMNGLAGKTPGAKRQAWARALKAARDAGRIETDEHDLQIWIPSSAGEA